MNNEPLSGVRGVTCPVHGRFEGYGYCPQCKNQITKTDLALDAARQLIAWCEAQQFRVGPTDEEGPLVCPLTEPGVSSMSVDLTLLRNLRNALEKL